MEAEYSTIAGNSLSPLVWPYGLLNMDKNKLVEKVQEESWTYIRTVVDVVHEPILILNRELCVLAANEPFYRMFQVEKEDTEHNLVYELGNGQWNIPALKKLLEDILPKNTFFKGFEVIHKFPVIGNKVMILNARRIYFDKDNAGKIFPPIVLLAIEDVTEIMNVAEALGTHTKRLEASISERTKKLETHILKLEKEIAKIKKTVPIK